MVSIKQEKVLSSLNVKVFSMLCEQMFGTDYTLMI